MGSGLAEDTHTDVEFILPRGAQIETSTLHKVFAGETYTYCCGARTSEESTQQTLIVVAF